MANAKGKCNLFGSEGTRETLRQIQAATKVDDKITLSQDDIIVAALKLYLKKNKDIQNKIEEMNREAK